MILQKISTSQDELGNTHKTLNMKLSKIVLGITAVGAFAFVSAQNASALPSLTGGISYSGGYTAENAGGTMVTDLTLATQIVFDSPGNINGINGVLASASGAAHNSPITLNGPLIISPLTGLSPLYSFGTVSGSTTIITFDLLTVTVDPNSDPTHVLDLEGTGKFTGAGFDDTAATWTASFNTQSGTFSFSASSGSVPDGGSTVALLGCALVGMEVFRRKVGSLKGLRNLVG